MVSITDTIFEYEDSDQRIRRQDHDRGESDYRAMPIFVDNIDYGKCCKLE